MFSLQSPPLRRDQSFHAQTRGRLPASFGSGIWPHKCNRHATVEICSQSHGNLQVERLCSEQELRSASRAFFLQKHRIKVRTGLALCAAWSVCFDPGDDDPGLVECPLRKFQCAAATINHYTDTAAM